MKILQHKFIELIPEVLEPDILYISIIYCTAIHLCVCGCGNEVVTPLSPTDWQITFNGRSISLSPSIGNWSFDCKSHYWIIQNKVKYAGKWTYDEIEIGRQLDKSLKEDFYLKDNIEVTISEKKVEVFKPVKRYKLWKLILQIIGKDSSGTKCHRFIVTTNLTSIHKVLVKLVVTIILISAFINKVFPRFASIATFPPLSNLKILHTLDEWK